MTAFVPAFLLSAMIGGYMICKGCEKERSRSGCDESAMDV